MKRYVVSWLGVGLALVVFGCGRGGPVTMAPSSGGAVYTTQQRVTEEFCRQQYNECMRRWGDDTFGRRLCSDRLLECRRNIPSPFVFARPYVRASVRRVRLPVPSP